MKPNSHARLLMRWPVSNYDRSLAETLDGFSAYRTGELMPRDIEGQRLELHTTNHCGVQYDVTLKRPGAHVTTNTGSLVILPLLYPREVNRQPLSVLQSRRCAVRRWRPRDHGTGSRCKNWPNNALLGRNLDEEPSRIETHPVLSFIRAAIAVRHDVQRVFFFPVFVILGQVGPAWREVGVVPKVIVNSPSRILQW